MGLTSPNGLGPYGLLRVHTGGGVEMTDSTITGIDGTGAQTALAAGAGLIEVTEGRIDVVNSVLCGFIADVKGQPLVSLQDPVGSAAIYGTTFMNLDGVTEGQGFIRVDSKQSVFLYNNTFVGALGGEQSAVFSQFAASLILFNNLFHQLATGVLIEASVGLEGHEQPLQRLGRRAGGVPPAAATPWTPSPSSRPNPFSWPRLTPPGAACGLLTEGSPRTAQGCSTRRRGRASATSRGSAPGMCCWRVIPPP
ncbi:MAG: hypothetical protein IPN01_12825 [Deltaproteobacteria bacterium]|nr:hypothetical protein [Deltaproteobacteria bacterium]